MSEHQDRNNQTSRVVVSSIHKPPSTRPVKPGERDRETKSSEHKSARQPLREARNGRRMKKLDWQDSWGELGLYGGCKSGRPNSDSHFGKPCVHTKLDSTYSGINFEREVEP